MYNNLIKVLVFVSCLGKICIQNDDVSYLEIQKIYKKVYKKYKCFACIILQFYLLSQF